jgi:FAD/FMN-containing dehydrogenase
MSSPALADTSVLEAVFGGRLLSPGSPAYDDVRRLHNGLVDKRPALIARCLGTADIVAALAFARLSGLPVAVRGGGHNVAGRASIDGGLMVDLSLMKGIHVNPRTRRARAQGGVTWGELNRESQLHALATTGGVVSTTGIAGLTLGGGIGHTMGKYGLAVDNLRSAEVVTADGRVLQASAEENTDLFWALRGGGGNFGVVSSFEFELHQVGPTVTAGVIAYPLSAARDALKRYRDFTASEPDEFATFAALGPAPDGSDTKIAAILVSCIEPGADTEKALTPLRSLGSPIVDTIGPMDYCVLNALLDPRLPRGAMNYWKSSFLRALSDEAIDAVVGAYEACPAPMSQVVLEHVHGAVCRVPQDATAFPHRDPGYNLLFLGQWMDPSATEGAIRWTREAYAGVQPFVGAGRYVNYLDDDEAGDPVAAAYGPNYRRLQQIKARYDPDNFFRQNQNIRPLA